jgi:prolyl-tRNA synthetase
MGDVLLRLTDRHGRINCLGPTHEEVITDIVRGELRSYKQLPENLYQIQTKFRDEPRPRSGVLRSREFLMKDAYSFDADEASLQRSYDTMYLAYRRIFASSGVATTPVEADSGAIGGAVSAEFMVLTPAGEDKVALCRQCGYAANTERCPCAVPEPPPPAAPEELREVSTPGAASIAQVSEFLRLPPERLVKTLVYTVAGTQKKAPRRPIAVLVRGDHEVNEAKLAKLFPGQTVELADAETIGRVTGAPVGFAGPRGIEAELFVDDAVAIISNFAAGANKADAHVTGLNWDRDLPRPRQSFDLRLAQPGDGCPKCEGLLELAPGIELGHVFQLGTKYSQAMGASYLDKDGKSRPVLMGCYGIGVNRILAAAIELHNDSDGISWPVSLAPYEVLVLAASPKPEALAAAGRIYSELRAAGADVLFDDREDVRPGVKFKDADLIGFPLRVVVGDRGLKEGVVELVRRSDKQVDKVPPERAVAEVMGRLEAMRAELRAAADACGPAGGAAGATGAR